MGLAICIFVAVVVSESWEQVYCSTALSGATWLTSDAVKFAVFSRYAASAYLRKEPDFRGNLLACSVIFAFVQTCFEF